VLRCTRRLLRWSLLIDWLLAAHRLIAAQIVLEDGSDGALVLGKPALLAPGIIVGQGRYVLAEKLCDLCHSSSQPSSQHQAHLPPPSERLFLEDPQTNGQLVPYEGLARAIAQDLPLLPLLPYSSPNFLPAVYDYSVSFVRGDPLYKETWKYRFGDRLGRGAFGEVWRAVALDGSMREVVLKRLFVERGGDVRLSGEREIYFGTLLQHKPHIARFIESFEHLHVIDGSQTINRSPELWLVFYNEGFALSNHLFHTPSSSSAVEPSDFWWVMKKQQPVGEKLLKNIAYQLLHGLAFAHKLNITHRDIKLSNILATDTWPPVVRICDWGSSLVLPATPEITALYGLRGPSDADETHGYQPPEAIFDSVVLARSGVTKEHAWRKNTYDMWSLGVLLLEVVLGTRDVFSVDQRRWKRTERQLRQEGLSHEWLIQAQLLQALSELCLGPRGIPADSLLKWLFSSPSTEMNTTASSPELSGMSLRWCSDSQFAEVLKQRDIASIGFPSAEGRDLLQRLLEWSPVHRISASDALAHSWFDDDATLPPLHGILPASQGHADKREKLEAATSSQQRHEDGMQACACVGRHMNQQACVTSLKGPLVPVASCTLASSCPQLHLYVGANMQLGRRQSMEDRFSLHNLTHFSNQVPFVGVYDGHGGSAVADWLMHFFHHRLLQDPEFTVNVSASLDGAFVTMDRELSQKHVQAQQDSPKGCVSREESMLIDDKQDNDSKISPACSGEESSSIDSNSTSSTNCSNSEESIKNKTLSPRPLQTSGSPARVSDPGSTALVVVMFGCKFYLANLGDCRAIVAKKRSAADKAEEGAWPIGARVEFKDAPTVDLRWQRGTIVEVRSSKRRVYIIRLSRDGALRPAKQSALRLLSELSAHRLTHDHKPGVPSERRRIEELGGRIEMPSESGGPARIAGLATSRSLGSFAARPFVSIHPDIHEYVPENGRDVFMVLASDGVWDVLADQLVVDLVWDQVSGFIDSPRGRGSILAEAAELIVQTALEKGSMDNLTCVIVLLSWHSEVHTS